MSHYPRTSDEEPLIYCRESIHGAIRAEARAAGRAEALAEAREAIRDMAGSLTSSEPLSDEDWAKRSADDLLSRDTVLAVLSESRPEAGVEG